MAQSSSDTVAQHSRGSTQSARCNLFYVMDAPLHIALQIGEMTRAIGKNC